MGNVLNWVVNLIPEQYRVAVAIKKLSYFVGKFGAGFVTAKLITSGHLTVDQASQIELAITAATAGGLQLIHDWARVKWPEAKWL